MAAKAKAKKTAAQAAETNGHSPTSVGELIPIGQLQPSPTNPRKRFPEESIEELATSIREQGVIEPLIVRKVTAGGDGVSHEIVCGERRYRASSRTNLERLPCIVRDLTDDQVLDIQIHENLHREDVHPMDEAYGYKFLKKKLGCDDHELATRVGKPEAYVQNRLKLNDLMPGAQKSLEKNELPLGHALEIVKFKDPKIQEAIFKECFRSDWSYGTSVTSARPLKSVLAYINRTFLLQLSKAPFNIKATDLRKDALACGDCPDRTGATPGLFTNYEAAKNDNCLNKACYEGKIEQNFQNKLAALAIDLNVDVKNVPLVDFNSYVQGGKVLGYYEVTQATKKDADKKGVLVGISASSDSYGKTVYFRKKAQPKSSSSKGSSSSSGGEKSPADKEQFYKRKEEIWNCNVAEAVRWQVLALAAVKFGKQFKVTGGGDNFVLGMSAKLWERYRGNHQAVINSVAGSIDMEPNAIGLSQYTSQEDAEKKIAKLPASVQTQLLYLLIHSEKCSTSSGYWHSQAPILAIANEWKIDYPLIDAKARVEQSAKKHQQAHDDYLKAVETDVKNAKIPALYSEKWKRD